MSNILRYEDSFIFSYEEVRFFWCFNYSFWKLGLLGRLLHWIYIQKGWSFRTDHKVSFGKGQVLHAPWSHAQSPLPNQGLLSQNSSTVLKVFIQKIFIEYLLCLRHFLDQRWKKPISFQLWICHLLEEMSHVPNNCKGNNRKGIKGQIQWFLKWVRYS